MKVGITVVNRLGALVATSTIHSFKAECYSNELFSDWVRPDNTVS